MLPFSKDKSSKVIYLKKSCIVSIMFIVMFYAETEALSNMKHIKLLIGLIRLQ